MNPLAAAAILQMDQNSTSKQGCEKKKFLFRGLKSEIHAGFLKQLSGPTEIADLPDATVFSLFKNPADGNVAQAGNPQQLVP